MTDVSSDNQTQPRREEADVPPDVSLVKEKLEAKSGKKYRYRPKEDLPTISHMMKHGAPEDEGRPRTWKETVGYPTILALLFAGSFFLFLKLVPPDPNPKFILPTTKNAKLIHQRQQQQRAAANAKKQANSDL